MNDDLLGAIIVGGITLVAVAYDVCFIAQYIRTFKHRTRENLVNLAGFFPARHNSRKRREKMSEREIMNAAPIIIGIVQLAVIGFVMGTISLWQTWLFV